MLSLLEHCITGVFVTLTIKSVDETLWGYHSSGSSSAAAPSVDMFHKIF